MNMLCLEVQRLPPSAEAWSDAIVVHCCFCVCLTGRWHRRGAAPGNHLLQVHSRVERRAAAARAAAHAARAHGGGVRGVRGGGGQRTSGWQRQRRSVPRRHAHARGQHGESPATHHSARGFSSRTIRQRVLSVTRRRRGISERGSTTLSSFFRPCRVQMSFVLVSYSSIDVRLEGDKMQRANRIGCVGQSRVCAEQMATTRVEGTVSMQ